MTLDEFAKMMGATKAEFIPLKEGERKMEGREMNPQADPRTQLLDNLLSGKLEAPNDFIGFMVEKMRSVKAEGDMLGNQIQQGEQQLMKMREQLIKFQGRFEQYGRDIIEWMQRKPEEEVKPKNPKEKG